MGRKNRKEARIKKVADEAFESEIERKQQKIPDVVKDDALFQLDSEKPKDKKSKIILHPRIPPAELKKPEVRVYTDIWSNEKPVKKPRSNSKKIQKQKPKFAPTSAEAYNSEALVKPKIEEETSVPPAPIDPSIVYTESDDGMVDTMVDHVELPQNDPSIPIPNPPEHPPKLVEFPRPIKRYYDEETKKRLREETKAARAKLREIQNKPIEEENANFGPEEIEKLKEQIEEEKNRPHKPKVDVKAEMFIAAEPELRVDKQVEKFTDLQPDTKGFARLQRSFEIRRKVGLHE